MEKKNIIINGLPHWNYGIIKSITDVTFIENNIISDIDYIFLMSEKYKDIVISEKNFSDIFNGFFISINEKIKNKDRWSSFLEFYSFLGKDNLIKEEIEESLNRIEFATAQKINYNKDLYLILKSLYSLSHSNEDLLLSINTDKEFIKETKKILFDFLHYYEKDGINLSEEKQKRLKEIDVESAQLSSRYELNMRQANNSIIIQKQELIGLTENQLKNLVDLGDGTFKIGVDYPTYALIMSYCENRDVRKLLYHEFEKIAYPANESILRSFISLKNEKALLLGYKDFPSYDFQDTMAGSVAKVEQMLASIFEATKEKALKEKEVLLSFAEKEFNDSFGAHVMPWDISYLNQMYKNKYFNVDEKEVSEYFPASYVIKNIFQVYEKFFGVEIKLVNYTDESWKYDSEMITARVFKNSEVLGDLILDLYPRESKYTHACAMPIISPTKSFLFNTSNKVEVIPVCAIIANFTKSIDNEEPLFKFLEVETLLHELGHALHGLLGLTYYSQNAGLKVKYDFVEVPSQLLEQWFLQPEIIKMISHHYKTGMQLSDEIINKKIEINFYDIGLFYQRQLALSLFSLHLFQYPHEDIFEIRKKIYNEIIFLVKPDFQTLAHCSFGHLVSGYYGPKYYVYLWSLMYAIDLFVAIKKANGLLDASVGQKLIDCILSKGGSIDPHLLLVNFLGVDPNPLFSFNSYINQVT